MHVPSCVWLTWYVGDPLKKAFFCFAPGVRPFPCPHCDKIFRTSGHRKTHIASHFKNLQQKKHKFPRKSNKAKVSKSNLPLPDIPLQEPILITDFGKSTWQVCEVDQSWSQYMWWTKGNAFPSAFDLTQHCTCLFPLTMFTSYLFTFHLIGLIPSQNPRLAFQQYLEVVGNDRPYKCQYCSKAYKKSSHLKQHVR